MTDKERLKELKIELESLIERLDLVTIGEAASRKKIDRSAISQLIKRGRLETEEIIGKTLVYGKALEEFRHRKPGPPTAYIKKNK